MQSPSLVEPVVDTYVPLGQFKQSSELALPLASRYWPAPQGMHACFASGEYLPTSHSVQLLPPAFTSVSVTDPALHSKHTIVGSLEYLPAAQPLHLDRSCSFGTVPFAHRSHVAAWSALMWPALHFTQSVVALGEYWPLLQATQAMPPTLATLPLASRTTEPALHCLHVMELGPLNWPASQLSHDVMLSRPWYCPASQILQNACVWASWYLPAGHSMQLPGALALGWNMPIAHGWQSWPAW